MVKHIEIMALEASKDLEFSDDLVEWFWSFGVDRQAKYPAYAISTSEWLKIAYEVKKELGTVAQASKTTRPCTAIWGPSQTGKSTLVCAYLDQKAQVNGILGEDGIGSALHWQGGEPALFMDPSTIKGKKAAPGTSILNPFNNGKDASACLSHFVYGSLTPKPGAYHVVDPKFPIQIQLATEKDLLHALARGFDSDCWGHAPNGIARSWNIERLIEAIQFYQNRAESGDDATVNRSAYEMLHDFCEVLDDLVFAGVKRYGELGANERKYRSVMASILAEKALISSAENAGQFIARVLWEECEPFTEHYRLMRNDLRRYGKEWSGKTIHCDIQTAVLLLDMDVFDLLSGPIFPFSSGEAQGSKSPAKVSALVRGLGCRIDRDKVFVGQYPEKRLFEGDLARGFAVFQGLVWELTIPLNPEHLLDSPFLKYLEKADLLDFPGVANVVPSPSTRVKCECSRREKGDGAPATSEQAQTPFRFDASAFFTQILKRGKTASIVSTYAQRLTIDSFVIFQNIDGNPAANSEQLQTGIMTWWKAMVPSYFKEHEGKRSPLPLNLGLLWWTRVFNEMKLDRPNFVNYSWIWKNLGKLGDPRVVTSFALHYWNLPRASLARPDMVDAVYQQILKEDAFRDQFSTEVSRKSFEQMYKDRETGGANYFFSELLGQVDGLRHSPDFQKDKILQRKREEGSNRIQGLLDERNLFPPPEERDIRKENLIAFKQCLDSVALKCNEPQMRALNYALRVFLNMHQDDLGVVPSHPNEVSEQYICDQYERWINCQVERYRRTSMREENTTPTIEWSLLGITSETHCREYLSALVSSIRPEQIKEAEVWLIGLVEFAGGAGRGRVDYRPYLATRLANEIVFGAHGVPTFDGMLDEDTMGGFDDGLLTAPVGKSCPSYMAFVRDFLERRLPEMINMNLRAQMAPRDLPGAQQLRELCEKYGHVPQVYAVQ